MKLGTILWRGLLTLMCLAALAQYWLVGQTHEAARRIAARLIPQGDLRYEKLWPNPWGTGRVWGLSFQPEGLLRLNLQTPPGFRVRVQELRIDELRRGPSGGLERLQGRLLGVEIPVSQRGAPASGATGPADVPPPTLSDLGYKTLRFDLDFSVRYIDEAGLAVVTVNAAGAEIGRANLIVQLEGTPQTFDRAADQILLRKAQLEFADGGVLSKFKDVAAARSRVSRPAWEQATIARVDFLIASGKWRWDEATAQALLRAIRESGYWRATIDPPGAVALRNIRMYKPGDWQLLLGFTLETEGSFDHPPPDRD
ncbi:MAG: hypothetical protein ACT4QA_14665 [Panacagrimonas sp.]